MKRIREPIFAAWLANIDRLYEKGQEALVEKYRMLLDGYMDTAFLLRILRKDQSVREICDLVDYGYRLSLCESEKKERTALGKNLTSVFSRVTVTDGAKTQKRHYSLHPEMPEFAFPEALYMEQGISELENGFDRGMSELAENPPESWENFIVRFDGLLRKYAWCVTASDYEGEDISLYNQSRIAAAIVACICQSVDCLEEWKQIKDENWAKLIVSDFSGIQKYVFSVTRVSESGVAKRLRARSFYVDIVVSVIAQEIIHKFGLTQNHILLQTGGKFYILLPNCKDADALLEAIEKQIDEDFLHQFKGQIAIHLAWLPVGERGLEFYSETVTEITELLREKKSRAFSRCLIKEGKWDEDAFVLSRALGGKRICPSCQSELMGKDDLYCENCRVHTEIGGKLPRTKYISYYDRQVPGAYHIYGNYWIRLDGKISDRDAFLVEQINGEGQEAVHASVPLKVRYMANHIPVNEQGETLTFSDIAERAEGVHRLGILKADVDNLGYIFADGLRQGKKHFGTISRVNTMSRLLEIFFSGYINQLISQEPEFRNVYSVFSGGDDLFLIGPWDVMPSLAERIAKEFSRFAAGNLALTISAAVSVFYPKEHIANLAELSEGALKKVKNTAQPLLYPQKQGKNGISFMGEIYSWEDLREQLEIGKRAAALLADGVVGTSALRRIGQYSRMYKAFLLSHDVMALMFEPLFHYDRQRNYSDLEKRKDSSAEVKWFMDYIAALTENAADLRIIKKNLYFAESTVAYAMNLTREVR